MLGLGLGLAFSQKPQQWTPAALGASLQAWFRGDLGITLDGSSNVSAWADQSGNGNDASQAASGNRPGYASNSGLGYLISSASTGLEVATWATISTPEVFIVVKPTSATPGSSGYILDSNAGNNTALFQKSTTGLAALYTGGEVDGGQITAADHIVDGFFDGAASNGSFVAIDGGTATIGTLSNVTMNTHLWVGCYGGGFSFGFVGRLYEVAVCTNNIGSENRANMIAYLKARYGIT